MFSDIVNNRKSRSLFSGAKRWFGQVMEIKPFVSVTVKSYVVALYIRLNLGLLPEPVSFIAKMLQNSK
jgi:hypothetical protein